MMINMNNKNIELYRSLKFNLSIQEFINETKYDIAELKMDNFWHSIENNKYIILDDELMRELSESDRIDNVRKDVKKVLDKNNVEYVESLYDELLANGSGLKFENDEEK